MPAAPGGDLAITQGTVSLRAANGGEILGLTPCTSGRGRDGDTWVCEHAWQPSHVRAYLRRLFTARASCVDLEGKVFGPVAHQIAQNRDDLNLRQHVDGD